MSTLKKIFFLSLLLLGISLLTWGVYALSFKNTSSSNQPKKENSSSSSTANKNNSSLDNSSHKIIALSSEKVIAPILSKDGLFINYFSQSGFLYQINLDGSGKRKLSEKSFSPLNQAFWSPDRSQIILKFKNSSDSLAYYNLLKDNLTPFKKAIDTLVWNANSNKIFYKFFNPQNNERSLNISDPDSSHWRKLIALNYRYLSIARVPRSDFISFWNTGDAYQPTILQTISALGEKSKIIFQSNFGADYLWSPSGNQVLVSHSDVKGGHKIELAIMNYNGGEYINLGIPTFVSKCVWSKDNQTIYYALPGEIPAEAILPNDYQKQEFNTTDTFWKVNLKTGEKSRLINPKNIQKKYDVSQMFLNQDESLLFFVNRLDGKLYRLKL